ncbi:MAG: rhodanese-like domain-containing protein [Clostridiales bacterium]|nr:rhodanese-like domain-containing protein [Clostridiales bacterium]
MVRTITAEEAKEMMETLDEYIIVDVREQYEYDAGHIEGAVLVPVGSIEELASELLPDKDMTLLLYCRSGNRSAQAAAKLLEMGYSNIYDFGGIRDWPYETQTVEAA